METTETNLQSFLPKHELARIAVERARQIVRENNALISQMKLESNIDPDKESVLPLDAEHFSHTDSHAFDLYKIKSSNNIKDFIQNIFGVH